MRSLSSVLTTTEMLLIEEQTVRADRFRPLLAAHAERDWLPAGTETALSDADRERLESLGYID